MSFNPREHLIQIKMNGKAADYLPVAWRLAWFRDHYPQGHIVTEEVCVDLDREVTKEVYNFNTKRKEQVTARGYARYRATITTGEGGVATGTKSESAVDFPDYIEKAETGAIGRALAALGFGTQFAPELCEGERIVDAPLR